MRAEESRKPPNPSGAKKELPNLNKLIGQAAIASGYAGSCSRANSGHGAVNRTSNSFSDPKSILRRTLDTAKNAKNPLDKSRKKR